MADNIQEDTSLSRSLRMPNLFLGGLVFIFVVFPIVQIGMGAAYLHDCPVAPILPVYLIVFGVICLLQVVLFAMTQLFPTVSDHWFWTGSITVAFMFLLGWFFYGSYLVYTMYPIYHRLINRPTRSEGSHFAPVISDYTKSPIDPVSYSSTITTPNYTESTSFNSSHFSAMTLDNMPSTSSDQTQTQTQSPSVNQTTMTTTTNQTLMNLIQTLAHKNSSDQMDREHPNLPQTGAARSVILYCDKNLYLFVFCTTTLIYVSIAITCGISSASKRWKKMNQIST